MPRILIVGLGNPGVKYSKTRHNIGFMVLDSLAKDVGVCFKPSKKFNAEIASYVVEGIEVFFMKPQTFMNLSGEAVTPFIRYYNITHILVIHDDLDYRFGDIRFKFGGSSGGHNGLKSLDSHFGSSYFRLRFGISRPTTQSIIDYVLGDFTPQECNSLSMLIGHAKQSCIAFYMYIQRNCGSVKEDSVPVGNHQESKNASFSKQERDILNILQRDFARRVDSKNSDITSISEQQEIKPASTIPMGER